MATTQISGAEVMLELSNSVQQYISKNMHVLLWWYSKAWIAQ
jgi:hypothetical protein